MQHVPISASERAFFHEHGFVVLDKTPLIDPASPLFSKLHCAFTDCFSGKFSRNGIYPDEWHWREGISKPHAVREICNAWKADEVVRSVVLSGEVGRLGVDLNPHWGGSRVGQDDLVWKIPIVEGERKGVQWNTTPNAATTSDADSEANMDKNNPNLKSKNDTQSNNVGGNIAQADSDSHNFVGYHIDSTYISDQFTPKFDNSVTVWIALDDADQENGVIEYLCGSHRVLGSDKGKAAEELMELATFHAGENSSSGAKKRLVEAVREKLKGLGLGPVEAVEGSGDNCVSKDPTPGSIFIPSIPKGCCVIHHQNTLHGSGPNRSPLRHRRALVVHLLQGDTAPSGNRLQFIDNPTYIYGRYKLGNSRELLEDFFPVTWKRSLL